MKEEIVELLGVLQHFSFEIQMYGILVYFYNLVMILNNVRQTHTFIF